MSHATRWRPPSRTACSPSGRGTGRNRKPVSSANSSPKTNKESDMGRLHTLTWWAVLPPLAGQQERDPLLGDAVLTGEISARPTRSSGRTSANLRDLYVGNFVALGARDRQAALTRRVSHVVRLGAEKEVCGIDADAVVAVGQDRQPGWYGAVRQFPRESRRLGVTCTPSRF